MFSLVSRAFWNVYFRRMGMYGVWNELDTFTALPASERRRILAARLYQQLQVFGSRADTLPEWRELAKAKSVDDLWAQWTSLPVLTKHDLQGKFDPERIRREYRVSGVINATGGSTGEPTRFLWDTDALRMRSAAAYYVWMKFGWKPGMPYMSIWGSQRDLGLSNSRRNSFVRWLRRGILLDGYAFGDETVEQVLSGIQKSRRIAMYGYTSLLEELAKSLQSRGIIVEPGKVAAVWNGGEPVLQEQSKLVDQVFGQPIQNHYGSREFGAIAYRPAGETSFSLMRPHVYVEVVDDANRPSEPGEAGRLLVTTLIGQGTPFLRYEIGDLATFQLNHEDESGITQFATLDGRKSGVLHFPNGKVIHNIFWNQLFKEYEEVKGFQVNQDETGSLDIFLQGAGMPARRLSELTGLIRNVTGTDSYTIEWVGTIPRTREGKLLQVVSRWST